jgi:hypothetical protein
VVCNRSALRSRAIQAAPPTVVGWTPDPEAGQCSRSTASTAAPPSFSVQQTSSRSRTPPLASSSASAATPVTRAAGGPATISLSVRWSAPAAPDSTVTSQPCRERQGPQTSAPVARTSTMEVARLRRIEQNPPADRRGPTSRTSTASHPMATPGARNGRDGHDSRGDGRARHAPAPRRVPRSPGPDTEEARLCRGDLHGTARTRRLTPRSEHDSGDSAPPFAVWTSRRSPAAASG